MLIVIVIIGILAAALIPRLQSVQERANATKVLKITYDVDVSMKIKELDLGVAPTGIWDFQGDFTDRSGLGNDFTTISELSNAFVRDTAFQKDRVLSGTGGSTER